MKILAILIPLFTLLMAGCSSSPKNDYAAKYAKEISDSCKDFAVTSAKKGYDLTATYSYCIDDALAYLEAKRHAREAYARSNGKNESSLIDIAKYFTKEEAKSRLTDLAKSKLKKL